MIDYVDVIGIVDRIWDNVDNYCKMAALPCLGNGVAQAAIDGLHKALRMGLAAEIYCIGVEARANDKEVDSDAVIARHM